MSFNLGKPILVMVILAVVTGVGYLFQPKRDGKHGDLTLWVFSETHSNTYAKPGEDGTPALVEQFRKTTGKSIGVELLSFNAENVRLGEMYMSDLRGPEVPDLAEIEIGAIGRFFRPPLNEIGFLPLNHYLETTGPESDGPEGGGPRWIDLLVKSRLNTWSKGGRIFGVPHDVHPVTISYRYDLFSAAGVDLESCKSWPAFQNACLAFQKYWADKAENRHAIELQIATPENLLMMLLQRGLNPIDENGKIYLTETKFVQTVAFYAQAVAEDRNIAAHATGGDGVLSKDIVDGNICAFMTADWRVSDLERFGGAALKGKLRMMPLPRFDEEDAPTATHGGTMIGIPKNCPNPDLAWKGIEFLYLSREGIAARRRVTKILPPVTSMWADKSYHQADPYYAARTPEEVAAGGQKIEEMYVELAPQIRTRVMTPASQIAGVELGFVLDSAMRHVRKNGPIGLEEKCYELLQDAARDLQMRVDHGKFEQ